VKKGIYFILKTYFLPNLFLYTVHENSAFYKNGQSAFVTMSKLLYSLYIVHNSLVLSDQSHGKLNKSQ